MFLKSVVLALLLQLFRFVKNVCCERYDWAPSANLSKWYSPWERCVIASTSEASHLKKIKSQCLREVGKSPGEKEAIFYCRAGEAFVADRNVLCRTSHLDPSMGSRTHFLQAVIGYDDPLQRFLLEFFIALAKNHGSLLLLGMRLLCLQYLRSQIFNFLPTRRFYDVSVFACNFLWDASRW